MEQDERACRLSVVPSYGICCLGILSVYVSSVGDKFPVRSVGDLLHYYYFDLLHCCFYFDEEQSPLCLG